VKASCSTLVGWIVMALAAAGGLAGSEDVEIHAVAKKVEGSAPQNLGHHTSWKEHWNYEVTVENKTFRPMPAVEVRYMIFYKTEELGSKAPPKQSHETGAFSFETLASHDKKSLTTNTVELKKSHLSGAWYYAGGERVKAEDTLAGVWVRVYQAGQQVGEYANPSVLMKEQWE
jgi:hypothetical protein